MIIIYVHNIYINEIKVIVRVNIEKNTCEHNYNIGFLLFLEMYRQLRTLNEFYFYYFRNSLS